MAREPRRRAARARARSRPRRRLRVARRARLLRDEGSAVVLVLARAAGAPRQEQRLEPAGGRRVLRERIRLFGPADGAPRVELDARRALLARNERDRAEHAVLVDGAA